MNEVWKFKFGSNIEMPAEAQVLDVQYQDNELYLWALGDPTADSTTRKFILVGTGHAIKKDLDLRYITTVQQELRVGTLVWHIFEDIS